MSLLKKSLWFIERDLFEVELEGVAESCSVSSFHLTKLFSLSLGQSLMRYVRARRLTEAAKRLCFTKDTILSVAIEVGYGSHEAFTRAFVAHFDCTPEGLRSNPRLDALTLTEPFNMNIPQTPLNQLPRFESKDAFHVTGLFQTYQMGNFGGISNQWQAFRGLLGPIKDPSSLQYYGISFQDPETGLVNYGTAVDADKIINPDAELKNHSFPKQTYAVFTHKGHVSGIGQLWMSIYNQWNPEWGKGSNTVPPFETYDARFDPTTGQGVVEIWIPVDR